MKAVLGLDTSCYTTSAAIVSKEGTLLASDRQLLSVKSGKRGLMQSEMVFQHVVALPDRIAHVMDGQSVEIAAVSASTRPRSAEQSYMPAFHVGEGQARTIASLLGVPFYPFSHQEGHVRAACYGTEVDGNRPYLAFHLSGGTTELLRVQGQDMDCVGQTLDLNAGQLIDRIGVRLGLPFPAGPSLEQLAMQGQSEHRIPGAMKGGNCSISGAENRAFRWIDQAELAPEIIAAEVFDFLARTVTDMLDVACSTSGIDQAVLAGGVMSSALLRERICDRARRRRLACHLSFARPELSGDNAVGIALLGADRFRAMHGMDS